MKAPFALLLALVFCTLVRADLAEVKKLMDEPVQMKISYQKIPVVNGERDRARAKEATGKEVSRSGYVSLSPREAFALAASNQGRTTAQMAIIGDLIARHSSDLRSKLLPAIKSAGLASAASDLEEALRLVESSKTIDRSAQDRFARVAKVAP